MANFSHFLALHIDDDQFLSLYEDFKLLIETEFPKLVPFLIKQSKLHITLGLLTLPKNPQQLQDALSTVETIVYTAYNELNR